MTARGHVSRVSASVRRSDFILSPSNLGFIQIRVLFVSIKQHSHHLPHICSVLFPYYDKHAWSHLLLLTLNWRNLEERWGLITFAVYCRLNVVMLKRMSYALQETVEESCYRSTSQSSCRFTGAAQIWLREAHLSSWSKGTQRLFKCFPYLNEF